MTLGVEFHLDWVTYAKCMRTGVLKLPKTARPIITELGSTYLYQEGKAVYVYPGKEEALKMLLLIIGD